MGKEKAKKQEPNYGSTVIVWIRPQHGKFCKIQIVIGDDKKSIMVPSSIFQDLVGVISMITEKIEDVNRKNEPDEL